MVDTAHSTTQCWRRRRQKTENGDRTTARRASGEKMSTKEAKVECPNGAQAKIFDDDEQKIYETFTQLNKVTWACQKGERAQPPAGEDEHTQQQARIKRTERAVPNAGDTYKENNVSTEEVGPMTRNKDIESHQRMATEQELMVAEKAREHQVEIEEDIEVQE